MENDEGQRVDLYLPRKCSATNRLIGAKQHSAVQLNVGQVDHEGKYTGEFYTFHLAGFIRNKGQSDACLNRLLYEKGLLSFSK
jgi:small subunit ribosomal protein S21e